MRSETVLDATWMEEEYFEITDRCSMQLKRECMCIAQRLGQHSKRGL